MSATVFTLAAGGMTVGERAAYAGKMFLIGFGAVLGVLALLWGILSLFHYIASTGQRRAEARKPLRTPVMTVPAPAQQIPEKTDAPAQTDEALVAVLTAAVAAAIAEERGTTAIPGFRVVSYRKV